MKVLAIPAFLILLLGGVVACNQDVEQVDAYHVENFVAHAGLTMPETATPTDYRSVFSMDGLKMLRVEMPAADLPRFLSASKLDGELGNSRDLGPAKRYLGDFLNTQPRQFREGQKDLGQGFFLNVLVDEDSTATSVVYLQWFGT